jgi:hypothetical protein
MLWVLEVRGVKCTPIRVVYVPAHAASTLGTSRDVDTVEFYDRRYDHTPNGQLISFYNAKTLLTDVPTNGLDLYGSEPSWKIPYEAWKVVYAWIEYHYEYRQRLSVRGMKQPGVENRE